MDKPQGNVLSINCPRVVLCGLRGGSGKTVLTLGLIGALRKRGLTVSPFKKGPDYIDPQWLSLAAGRPCRNLDAFLMEREQILASVSGHSRDADIVFIEGNRGLYDGMDDAGTFSTAELAVMLDSPVLLIVDCTKTTRTAAAMVLGCKMMNADLKLGGVILNQVACDRQETVIRAAVEKETGLPVVGALRRLKDFSFDERHLGLYPPPDHAKPLPLLERMADEIENHVDVESVFRLAATSSSLPVFLSPDKRFSNGEIVRVGVIRDAAFHFYYPENLEALERNGARMVEISAVSDPHLADVDALYIGGGFPEAHAAQLADNDSFREELAAEIEKGLPVLAECGGLIYLGKSLSVEGKPYPMTGVFPVSYTVSPRPQGHGYTILETDRDNPFFPRGMELRGHEFRYAAVTENHHDMRQTAFHVHRGFGFDGVRDGLLYKNVMASFCHHHTGGTEIWAENMVRLAVQYKRIRQTWMNRSCGTFG